MLSDVEKGKPQWQHWLILINSQQPLTLAPK